MILEYLCFDTAVSAVTHLKCKAWIVNWRLCPSYGLVSVVWLVWFVAPLLTLQINTHSHNPSFTFISRHSLWPRLILLASQMPPFLSLTNQRSPFQSLTNQSLRRWHGMVLTPRWPAHDNNEPSRIQFLSEISGTSQIQDRKWCSALILSLDNGLWRALHNKMVHLYPSCSTFDPFLQIILVTLWQKRVIFLDWPNLCCVWPWMGQWIESVA